MKEKKLICRKFISQVADSKYAQLTERRVSVTRWSENWGHPAKHDLRGKS